MRILGIDPALSCTGFYILDNESILINDVYGEITPKEKGIKKFLEIEEEIKDKLLVKIDLAVMEEFIYSPYYAHAIVNIELVAILKRMFYINQIPLVLVAPSVLKKFITGSGRTKKSEILRSAYQKWGISESEHIVEAFALAKIGEMVMLRNDERFVSALKKYEREVLKSVTERQHGQNYRPE